MAEYPEQRLIESIRDECNPSRGRPAYVSAILPCEHVKKPCDLQIAPTYPDDPVAEEKETPPCIAVRAANNPSEVLQNFTWVEANDRYEADDGSTASYSDGLGWVFTTTGNGNYDPATVSTSPVGLYCNAAGDYITVTTCDKGSPVIDLPDCIGLVYVDDGTITLDSFSNTNDQYNPDNSGSGTVTYNGANWIYSVNGVTYTGPSDEASPFGLYIDANGRCVLFKDDCVAPTPPCNYPACVEIPWSSDPNVTPGQYNNTPSGAYQAVAPAAGILFWNGVNWSFSEGGTTFLGPDTECSPLGVYTVDIDDGLGNITTEYVVIVEC